MAEALLVILAHQPLLSVLDGSIVERGCVALMLSDVYHRRGLPLTQVVVRGTKAHFSKATHWALIAQIQALVPPMAQVTVLGDGEFNGTALQAALRMLH